VCGECVGNVIAQIINLTFQLVIEKVTHHCHPAPHPLARSAKLGMAELGHGAIAVVDGYQHVSHRIGGEAMSLGEVLNQLISFVRQFGHVDSYS
jgi:hypothetical protein